MKRIVIIALLVASFAVTALAEAIPNSFVYTSNITCTFNMAKSATITKTAGKVYTTGTYYQIRGLSVSASSDVLFLGVGSGSTSTGNYTPRISTVIPLVPQAFTVGDGATRNFTLDLDKVWYEQQSGSIDCRGQTLNMVLQTSNSAGTGASGKIGAAYFKLGNVLFSK